MVEPDTITLPKSGVALTGDGASGWNVPGLPSFLLRSGKRNDGPWLAGWINENDYFIGTRDECLAWLDARVLELRAALLPPGAIVVSDTEETVERVAREIHAENVAACDGVTEWEDACESVRQFTMCQAGAVLAALRESRP